MKKNEALAVFEGEYTRLYETLYETHRSEKALSNQCIKLKVNCPLEVKSSPSDRLVPSRDDMTSLWNVPTVYYRRGPIKHLSRTSCWRRRTTCEG